MVHLVGSGLLAQTITRAIGGSDKATWITLAVTIPSICIGPSVAQATDFWGRKWFVVVGMFLGTVGTIVVSRSNDIATAIAGQTIAGIGGSPTQALTHAIMSEILPRKHRPLAQAAIQISVGLASVTGLYVGGAMCRHNPEGFRHFYYFVAACFFATGLLFALLYRPLARELQLLSLWEKVQAFDIVGTILTLVAFLGICIGLGWSQNPYSWSNLHVFLPFVIGIVALVAIAIYAYWIRRDGIYHWELFKSRNFVIAEVCFFAEGFLFLAFNNYLGYQISVLYGKDLFLTALEYSVAWYLVPVGAFSVGLYSTRTKTIRAPVVFSFLLMAVFWAAMAGTTDSSTGNQIYGLVILYGYSLGIAICILIVLAQLSIPSELVATATGLSLATRAAGGTVGLAVYDALFNNEISNKLVSEVSQAALSLGLPPASLRALLGALEADDQAAFAHVPGITPQIIQASVHAFKSVFSKAFQHVYIMSCAMLGFAIIGMRNISALFWFPKWPSLALH